MTERLGGKRPEEPGKGDWRDNLDSESFEYIARDLWDRYKRKIKMGLAGVAAVATLWSGVYTVPQDSRGIVTCFGEYSRTANPGLNFKIPYVEKVQKVTTDEILTECIGFRALKPGIKSEYIGTESIDQGKISDSDLTDIIVEEGLKPEDNLAAQAKEVLKAEYLMLTGDLNMADVEFIIQYKISDPVSFLFNVKDAKAAIRDVAEAKMRIAVGDASVDEVLTTGRADLESEVKIALQERMNFYNTGVKINTVKLQSTQPPERVQSSFNEVNSALAQKQEKINSAMSAYNQEVPKAKGEAEALLQKAEGYATERVNNAIGDTARFRQIWEQYKNAPAITRARMYLEALPGILEKTERIFYIENSSNGKGDLLLKKLDLNSISTNGGGNNE